MKMHLLKFLLLNLIVLLIQIHGPKACLEEERRGLLELKSFLQFQGYEGEHVFHSWVDDDPKSDCCFWERVTCNSTTGRVIQLSLYNLRQQNPPSCNTIMANNDPDPRAWNITLFEPFKELRILNLSYNRIDGWIQQQGSEDFLRLQHLEILDLSCNSFRNLTSLASPIKLTSLKNFILRSNILEGSFPAPELSFFKNLEALDLSQNMLTDAPLNLDMEISLAKLRFLTLRSNSFTKDIMRILGLLSSLRSLDLSSNQLEGSLSNYELANLSNLEVLNLGFNKLNGSLPIKDLMTFRRLEILDLRNNHFVGSIPPYIGSLSSLKALYLSLNQLTGSLPNPGLCELKGLQKLDFGNNNLEGTLPSCLNNLTSLMVLDLHGNLLSGPISPYLISSPKSLQYIYLSDNGFEGSFVLSSIFNHSKLEVLIFGSRRKKLQIDIETKAGINPRFQLKTLELSDCNLKGAPSFLLNQHRLKAADLSHNSLNAKFPSWLLENNTDLEFLSLRNNCFTSGLHLPQNAMSGMIYMDVSDNNLGGRLPEDLGMVFRNLNLLNLSMNHFEGDVPSSIGGMRMLSELDLSSNNFSGEVPKDLLQNCTNLRMLMLSNNNFHGEIFSSQFNMSELTVLGLGNNQFTGSLTNTAYQGGLYLDVSNNNMTGKIPSWINNVAVLSMRNNYFEGQVPCNSEYNSWTFIDLSHNFLSGPLPSCSNVDFIEQIHLEGNSLTGSIPNALLNSSSLLVLNLRSNNLSGKVPSLISLLPSLRVLLLGNNHLSGSIPREICQLRDLSIVDLSNNSFSGSIPSCLSNVTFDTMNKSYKSIDQTTHYGICFIYGDDTVLGEEREILNHFNSISPFWKNIEIDFVTKSNLLSYKNDILNYMSGLDLSSNNLTGEIPKSLGKLFSIRALNLSHNHLTGSIPVSFSNLTKLESLDLSYNSLGGKIPSELVNLNFLEAFSVAHNNLSGRILEKGQFSTFDGSSYEGNPFLSGLPSKKNQTKVVDQIPVDDDQSEEKWYEIDHTFFFGSFIATYFVFLLCFGALLYINPYWRRRWLYFIEEFLYSTYYFVVDNVSCLRTILSNLVLG